MDNILTELEQKIHGCFRTYLPEINKNELAGNLLETGSGEDKYKKMYVRLDTISNVVAQLQHDDEVPYSVWKNNAYIKDADGNWQQVMKTLPDGSQKPAKWGEHLMGYMTDEVGRLANGRDVVKILENSGNPVSGNRQLQLSGNVMKEMMSGLPEGVAYDLTYAAVIRRNAGKLRALAGNAGGLENNVGIKGICNSLDALAELTEKTWRNAQEVRAVNRAAKNLATRIYAYLEEKSLDKNWNKTRGELRDELMRQLKVMSPELSEIWVKRKAVAENSIKNIEDKRELLNKYFFQESGKGNTTYRKIMAAWDESNEEGSISEIKDINLAPSGETKIEWVRQHCDLLRTLEQDFSKTKPFEALVALSFRSLSFVVSA